MARFNCAVAYCDGKPHGHAKYCNKHNHSMRRRGHPLQPPIRVTHIRPHKLVISDYLNAAYDHESGTGVDLWSHVRAAYRQSVDEGVSELRSMRRGDRHRILALKAVKALADSVNDDEAILTMMGFGHAFSYSPEMFKSHQAFKQTLAIRLYKLLPDVRTKRRHASGKITTDVALPRMQTLHALGHWAVEQSVVRYGVTVAVELQRRRDARNKAHQAVMAAIRATSQQDTTEATEDATEAAQPVALMIPEGEA